MKLGLLKRFWFLIIVVTVLQGCDKKHTTEITTAVNFRIFSPWYSKDGHYILKVKEKNEYAILELIDANGKVATRLIEEGSWTSDNLNNTIQLKSFDKTIQYTYFEFPFDNSSLLLYGSPNNADMTQSWFSVLEEVEEDDEPVYRK